MAILNQAMVDGAQVVARAVKFQVRQAASAAITSAISSATVPTPTQNSSGVVTSAASSSPMDPTTTPSQGASDNNNNDNKNSNTGSSSPLLFFVALGFGVVFTNLWIIVGVKYCFRYNARNRAIARLDENGEPIDLQNMPARPHRRRREKKLMTMDEVNEKFPMVKYKTWVLDRQKEGLPTAGGISAPASRANSVRSVDGIIPEQPSSTRQPTNVPAADATTASVPTTQEQVKPTDKGQPKPTNDTPNTTSATADTDDPTIGEATAAPATQNTANLPTKDSLHRTSEDDEDEDDDHIDAAMAPEHVGSVGDTCAICIDTLEDDDDVRGLTCGHAFHAVCLDPWLTNRRACCPLCKADYYTPKVRPQPAEGETHDPRAAAAVDPARNNGRMNYPQTPVRSFAWSHFRDAPRQMFPSRFAGTPADPAERNRQFQARRRDRLAQPSRRNTANQAQPTTTSEEDNSNFILRFRNRFPPFRLDQVMRRNGERRTAETNGASNSGNTQSTTTPSQLEAGVQPSATPAN
ncbi:hypothetical protein F5Y19DRAFT_481323 [Xylariaceae sp. FL1651]|nr:hypothetical protein F5Y19DRAFT_481323 [Xylariaceae sp. FL1651]